MSTHNQMDNSKGADDTIAASSTEFDDDNFDLINFLELEKQAWENWGNENAKNTGNQSCFANLEVLDSMELTEIFHDLEKKSPDSPTFANAVNGEAPTKLPVPPDFSLARDIASASTDVVSDNLNNTNINGANTFDEYQNIQRENTDCQPMASAPYMKDDGSSFSDGNIQHENTSYSVEHTQPMASASYMKDECSSNYALPMEQPYHKMDPIGGGEYERYVNYIHQYWNVENKRTDPRISSSNTRNVDSPSLSDMPVLEHYSSYNSNYSSPPQETNKTRRLCGFCIDQSKRFSLKSTSTEKVEKNPTSSKPQLRPVVARLREKIMRKYRLNRETHITKSVYEIALEECLKAFPPHGSDSIPKFRFKDFKKEQWASIYDNDLRETPLQLTVTAKKGFLFSFFEGCFFNVKNHIFQISVEITPTNGVPSLIWAHKTLHKIKSINVTLNAMRAEQPSVEVGIYFTVDSIFDPGTPSSPRTIVLDNCEPKYIDFCNLHFGNITLKEVFDRSNSTQKYVQLILRIIAISEDDTTHVIHASWSEPFLVKTSYKCSCYGMIKYREEQKEKEREDRERQEKERVEKEKEKERREKEMYKMREFAIKKQMMTNIINHNKQLYIQETQNKLLEILNTNIDPKIVEAREKATNGNIAGSSETSRKPSAKKDSATTYRETHSNSTQTLEKRKLYTRIGRLPTFILKNDPDSTTSNLKNAPSELVDLLESVSSEVYNDWFVANSYRSE